MLTAPTLESLSGDLLARIVLMLPRAKDAAKLVCANKELREKGSEALHSQLAPACRIQAFWRRYRIGNRTVQLIRQFKRGTRLSTPAEVAAMG
jgi:hypothetical protein